VSSSGGLRTALPSLTLSGALSLPVRSGAANTTLTTADFGFRATAGAGGITVTLPAAPVVGQLIAVKKVDAGVGVVTVAGNGATIDGAASQPLTNQLDGILIHFASPNWYTVAEIAPVIL